MARTGYVRIELYSLQRAKTAGCGMESVKKEVDVLLEEISHNMAIPAIRLLALLVEKCLT